MTERRATVKGTLSVGEASAAVRDLQHRTQGSLFGLGLLVFLLIVACIVGGYWVVNLLVPGETWGAIPGGIAAYLLFRWSWRRFAVGSYRSAFAARGLSLELPMQLEVGPDALISEIGGVKRIAQWTVVTELFNSHGYWIFLAQGDAIFAPERLFASKQDEREFVTAALSFMSEDAKARSVRAIGFAGSH